MGPPLDPIVLSQPFHLNCEVVSLCVNFLIEAVVEIGLTFVVTLQNSGVRILRYYAVPSKSGGQVDNSSTRGIFVVAFLYVFLANIQILIIFYKSLMYNSFTCQSILKLDCYNIFYKNTFQGHNPAFFLLTASKERRLLVYLKGGPMTG